MVNNESFGAIGDLDADSAYEVTFKGVPSGKKFYDPMNKVDNRTIKSKYIESYFEDVLKDVPVGLRKAVLSSGITAPTIIDADIIDSLRRETPVLELIPRRTQRGKTVSYNALTTRSASAFLGEGASLNDQDDSYTNTTASVKYSYSVGAVTGVAQAHESHYIDALAEVMRSKTVALRELHEQKFLTGDSTTTPLEYDGLDNIITTNSTSMSSAAVTIDAVGTILDSSRTYGGRGKKIGITDYGTLRDLKALMMQNVRYVMDTQEIAWGLKAVMYEDMPIVPSRFSSTTTNSKRFYIVDTEVTEYRVLQEPTMEKLAKTYDAERFFIKEYSVPVCKQENRCAMLTSIA